jgi:negative regulator of sigma E activity
MLNKRVRQLISAYIDGELSARKRRAVHRLIQSDPEARALYQQMKADSYYLHGLPRVSLPQDFSKRVLTKIQEKGIQPRPATTVGSWGRLAVAAMVLLAIGLASYCYFAGILGQPQTGEPNGTIVQKERQPSKLNAPAPPPQAPKDDANDNPDELREPEPIETARDKPTAKPKAPLVPFPPENPKAIPPGDEFAAPESLPFRPEANIRIEKPRLSVYLLRELDQAANHRRLQDELRYDSFYRLELFCLDSQRALERVQAIFRSHNLRLSSDAEAQSRLAARTRTDFLLYADDLEPEELASILRQLGSEDKKLASVRLQDGVFGRLVLNPLRQRDLASQLGVDAGLVSPEPKTAPLGVDIRKPVSETTAEQVAELAGQPRPGANVAARSLRTAYLCVNYPLSRGRPGAAQASLTQFLEARPQARPGTLQVLLILQNQ